MIEISEALLFKIFPFIF